MSEDRDDENRAAYRARLSGQLLEERYAKLSELRNRGAQPFANGFEVTESAAQIFASYGDLDHDALVASGARVRVAGRVRFFRRMGKACFIKLQDRSCRPGVKPGWAGEAPSDTYLQVFVSRGEVGEQPFADVLELDLGDIVGVEGTLMRTRTGELSVAATRVVLLTKSVRPLPGKFSGLSDVEVRYRQRYVDLVMNEDVREVFYTRSEIIRQIRSYLDARGYLEVETPMMHSTPGGASARPFRTHHNALDIELFLRIAPELYLKRLLVGGLERVYEINRNFRNEGLSRQHNPEFTMIEFYQAYATYDDLMRMTEEMISGIAESLHGRTAEGRIVFTCEGQEIDMTPPWRRVTIHEAVAEALNVSVTELDDRGFLEERVSATGEKAYATWDAGRLVYHLFEHHCERGLIQPTFVIDFPASVSPLSRRKDSDPTLVDRFELFCMGREIANAFSELNDPEDQYLRFADQLAAREAGDEEAMPMDEDYVRALEYGMPPAAGEGIGIDRLVMLLTDRPSIREVILFPQMRPE